MIDTLEGINETREQHIYAKPFEFKMCYRDKKLTIFLMTHRMHWRFDKKLTNKSTLQLKLFVLEVYSVLLKEYQPGFHSKMSKWVRLLRAEHVDVRQKGCSCNGFRTG